MDVSKAMAAHAEWKIKLRTGIANGSVFDVATVRADNCCDLGRWLHGEGRRQFAGVAAFEGCLSSHRAFHLEAAKVADLINRKQMAEAEALLLPGKPYAEASTAVGVALLRLKRHLDVAA